MTNSGRSSGIQCPESGPVIPVTSADNACVEATAKLPGKSPPKAGICHHLVPIQALL